MKIITAKSSGFCFGVRRAVSMCEKAAGQYPGCVTLGPIIHNDHVVRKLGEKGVRTVSDISEISPGDTVIIRSHGAGEADFSALANLSANVIDATCPYVKRIHDIVREESRAGRLPVIIGERSHPEVLAIAGWCDSFEIFETASELQKWLCSGNNSEKPLSVVFQTTEPKIVLDSCTEIVKKECTNTKIFDTICDATRKRQTEAAELAEIADVMVVIGGKTSANGLRLVDICRERCSRVIFVEDASGLGASDIRLSDTVGITAGASTPEWIIKEVTQKMSEEIMMDQAHTEQEPQETPAVEEVTAVEEESAIIGVPASDEQPPAAQDGDEQEAQSVVPETFEEMLEKSIKTLHTGEKVTGIVTSITATEVSVDLGTKQSGYIPASEFTDDPGVKVEDTIKIGDAIETFVMRVNDVEGMVMLSKKRLDAIKNWDDIEAARENRTVVEGIVTEENKGGVVVSVRGVRVFVPASQTGLPKSAPMTEIIKKTVKLRITEVNQSRRRVVGSIRAVTAEERREKADLVWKDIEVGKQYAGVVKSMTSYGVFVDIGGVDGMVHISELSWTRIKQPSEIMSVGDEVTVYVLSFDKENRKISLGYRKGEDNPWAKFTTQNAVGDVVNVKIVKMMPFGAFAEICPGVDGLIHISQITDHRIGLPSEVLADGQTVDVKITEIDNDRKKVSLSIRALIDPASVPVTEQEARDAAAEDNTPVIVYDTDSPPPAEPEGEAEESE